MLAAPCCESWVVRTSSKLLPPWLLASPDLPSAWCWVLVTSEVSNLPLTVFCSWHPPHLSQRMPKAWRVCIDRDKEIGRGWSMYSPTARDGWRLDGLPKTMEQDGNRAVLVELSFGFAMPRSEAWEEMWRRAGRAVAARLASASVTVDADERVNKREATRSWGSVVLSESGSLVPLLHLIHKYGARALFDCSRPHV